MKMLPILLLACVLAPIAAAQVPCPTPAAIPPATIVDVSTQFINAIVERPVDKVAPVRDFILENDIYGMGRTRGKVRIQSMTDANRAWVDAVLCGATFTKTIGIQPPAKAHSESLIQFEVHQPISIDGKSLRTWTPMAWARAETHLLFVTNMKGDPDSPVTGPARLQFKDDKKEIEYIAARRAEAKLKAEFAAELQPELANLAKAMADAWKSLDWVGIPLEPVRWSSTETYIRMQAGKIATAPLTAPPAASPPDGADITLRMHQSVFGQMTRRHLAGKTFNPLDLAQLNQKILNLFGSKTKAETGMDSIEKLLKGFGVAIASITFTDQDPATFQFGDNVVTLTLHGKSFLIGKTTYPARDVVVRYRIDAKAKEAALVRDGDIKIVPVGAYPDLDTDKNREVEDVLRKNFSMFLPTRLLVPKMFVPQPAMVLVPSRAEFRNGWLAASWVREQKK